MDSLLTKNYADTIVSFIANLDSNRMLINTGNAEPTAIHRNLAWLKLNLDGSIDGIYAYHDNNWYTPLATPLGTISIFNDTDLTPIGYSIITGVLSSIASGYNTKRFTGSQCLVKNDIAYKRFDQFWFS